MEDRLFKWLQEKRLNGACLSRKAIKIKAIELNNQKNKKSNYKASNGWFERFLSRFELSYRRVSSSGRDLPKNCQEIINNFLKGCQKFNQLDEKVIYNMDEASIYLDSPGNNGYKN